MSDVQLFYAELTSGASILQTAAAELLAENANISGDDVGIENPSQRAGLRLEFHRRLSALKTASGSRAEEGYAVASALTAISNRYSELDVELTGSEQP